MRRTTPNMGTARANAWHSEKLGTRATSPIHIVDTTPHSITDQLTPTERAIAVLVSEGKTNTEIGASLFLSPGTVKNYLSVALAKLHLSNRAALAVYAVTNDLRGDVVAAYETPVIDYDPDCYRELAFLAYA